MSPNKYHPHIFVLPEDKADLQIANGFTLNLNIKRRVIQVLEEAGGWTNVLSKFLQEYSRTMQKYPQRMMILLIDFDGDLTRFDNVTRQIPEDLQGRVFVLGVLSNPEELRAELGMSFETIGETLANNCRDGQRDMLWEHKLLRHNQMELDRMIPSVRKFLFTAD